MFMFASFLALLMAGLALDMSGDGSAADEGDDSWGDLPQDPAAETVPEDSHAPLPGGNEISGTALDDLLHGGDGPDRIHGGAGHDDMRGGLGHDTIFAGPGDDWVQGDGVYGPGGDDVIWGGAGDDLLCGQGGDDLIHGGSGNDTLLGGVGNDTLYAGAGDDWLSGNDGDDVLIAGPGTADLDGGRGDDLLIGHDGPLMNWLHGGDGDDTLIPGAGDFAEGQAGRDIFILGAAPHTAPIIADFNADEDRIVLHLPADMVKAAVIGLARDGDDTLLLRVNGETVGRLLQDGGLRVSDIEIVALRD